VVDVLALGGRKVLSASESGLGKLLAQIKADGLEMPVDRLLRRMNDPNVPEDRRDEIAAIVAPYTAPRLSAVTVQKRPSQMSDEEITGLLDQAKEDMRRLGIGGRNPWPRRMH
jgi:hypothetical protein